MRPFKLFCLALALLAVSCLDSKQTGPTVNQKPAGVLQGPNLSHKYLSEKTRPFYVNGSRIPEVDFDIGESYAGLLPISDAEDDPSRLYFWFFPSSNPNANNEITIWLNGGPGASSLEGLLQENGPFLWQYGTFRPVSNPWTWVHLTNMVWVDQPVGTGFSMGEPSAVTEEDVASQFMGFWKNFVRTFDLYKYRIFITGESYAGMYIPYLANAMLDAEDRTYFDFKGSLMNDPLINNNNVMRQIPAMAYVEKWNGLLGLNDTFLADVRSRARTCGYASFLEKYLQYPANNILPSPPGGVEDAEGICDIWDDIIDAATLLNPCFNIYQISTTCPLLWDVLGFPGSIQYLPFSAEVYFNRPDVKAAINAPDIPWFEASPRKMYNTSTGISVNETNNQFAGTTQLLTRLIDRSVRTVIGHAGLDYILLMNGTLLTLQNNTWGGMQGFKHPLEDNFYVPYHADRQLSTVAGAGVMGKTRTERGLTFYSVTLSGHMIPQYAPSAAYRTLEFLLGRIANLSSTEPFS